MEQRNSTLSFSGKERRNDNVKGIEDEIDEIVQNTDDTEELRLLASVLEEKARETLVDAGMTEFELGERSLSRAAEEFEISVHQYYNTYGEDKFFRDMNQILQRTEAIMGESKRCEEDIVRATEDLQLND